MGNPVWLGRNSKGWTGLDACRPLSTSPLQFWSPFLPGSFTAGSASHQIHRPHWLLKNEQKRKHACNAKIANCINSVSISFYKCIFPCDATAPFCTCLVEMPQNLKYIWYGCFHVQLCYSSLQSYQFASLSQYCENALSESLCLKFPVRIYQREFREDIFN